MSRLIDLAAVGDSPVGGKAAGLAKLAAAGFPVPPGMVVLADVHDRDLDDAAAELSRRFDGSTLAVRSSGMSEDLADTSFAGQFATLLGVEAEPASVVTAIRKVRDSVHADHVASYHHEADLRMAVLVMPMVDATTAGVAFSRNPVTGADEIVIEAVAGLGDRFAAGEEDGERWRVADGRETRISDSLGVLSVEQVRNIAQVVGRIEAVMGSGQDVEWAIADDRVIVLQSRPITTTAVWPVPLTDPIPAGPWERDMTHQLQPTTPLIGSFFPQAFTESFAALGVEFGMPLDRLEARVIRGYFYIQAVPFGAKPGGSAPPAPMLRALWTLVPKLRSRAKQAATMQARRRHFELAAEWHESARPEALRTIAEWTELDRAALDDPALAQHLEDTVELARWMFRWNVLTDLAYLLPLLDLVEYLEAHGLGDLGTALELLAGHSADQYRLRLDELAEALRGDATARAIIAEGSVDPMARLDRDAPAFAERYRSHLSRFGMRVLGFDLDAPTLLEDPRLELTRLADAATEPVVRNPAPDPAEELRRQLPETDRARFDAVVAEARRHYPIREDGESVHSAAWGAVRLAALEVGRRMTRAGHAEGSVDAVFLTGEELIGWLEQASDQRDRVSVRRGERAWAVQNPGPQQLGEAGSVPDARSFPPAVARLMRATNLVVENDSRMADLADGVDGVGVSVGTYVGPVRVVDGPHEFSKVHAGDVVVCRTTASPWEVLFPSIGALITEGGGLLSHPAIVAREHGLPAVLGVTDAMRRFHDGQLVTVDGAAGTVRPMTT